MHGYARRNSVEGLARNTACRAAGQIGESGPPRSTDVRKGSSPGQERTPNAAESGESRRLRFSQPIGGPDGLPRGRRLPDDHGQLVGVVNARALQVQVDEQVAALVHPHAGLPE